MFAAHNEARTLEQFGLVAAQFPQQNAKLVLGAMFGLGIEIEQDHQHPGSLNVAEETVPQALALGRTLDQSGDVGHDELGAIAHATDPHDSEMRHQGRERVVGDLGLGRRHSRDQGGLACVGKPHQGHVGHELELHIEPALLALLPLFGKGGGPATVGEEAGIASPALTTLGDEEPVTVARQIALHCALVVAHHGPHRDLHHDVLAPGAMLLLSRPVAAVGGPSEGMVPEPEQRRLIDRRHEPDIASVPPVTAVGPAAVDVCLTAPRHGARSAVAGSRVQLSLIDEACHNGPA